MSGAAAAEEKPATTTAAETPAGGSAAGTETPAKGATTPAAAAAGTTPAKSETPPSKAGDETVKPKAPAAYALKVPEGKRLAGDLLKEVEAVARANDWTQDEAQAEVDAVVARLDARADAFLTETKADKTYGGDKLAETDRHVQLALNKFAPAGDHYGDALRQLLEENRAGNHIGVVALLARVGKAMAEDTVVGGLGGGKAADVSAADKLYGPPKK